MAPLVPMAVLCCALAQPFQLDDVLAAIERVESSGRPWTILDNATGQSLDLPSRAQAERIAADRLGLGHNLDLGLYQINSIQLRRPDAALATIFDPGVQVQLARTILLEFLAQARELYGDTDLAWERAIGAYNDGNVRADNLPYVGRVLRQLGRTPLQRPAAADVRAAAIEPPEFTPFAFDPERNLPDRADDLGDELALAAVAATLLIAATLGLGWPLLIRATLAAAAAGHALLPRSRVVRRSAP